MKIKYLTASILIGGQSLLGFYRGIQIYDKYQDKKYYSQIERFLSGGFQMMVYINPVCFPFVVAYEINKLKNKI
jgi:hypothetical protein